MSASESKSVAEVCNLHNGHGFTPREWAKSGLPIIRIQNLNGSSDFNYFAGTPEPGWIVEPGTLLFAWAGTRGVSFGAFEWRGPRGVLNQHILRVVPKPGIDRDWLFFALKTVTERVERKAHGFKSSLLHVRRADITGQMLEVPFLKEQQRIAKILRTAEKRVRVSTSLLDALERRRVGLMQKLLAGEHRLSGEHGPWKRVPIGSVLTEVNRRIEMRDEELYRLASVRRNSGGLFERERLLGSEIKTKNLREVRAGDFLISHIQAAYGSMALVPSEFDRAKVSDLYTCLVSRDPAVFDIRFFSHLAQSPRMTYLCRIASNGFFAERLRLNFMPELFLQQVIAVPPSLKEQHRIVKILERVDQEVSLMRRALDAYRRQEEALLRHLIVGERAAALEA